jgi:hypothetical protein
MLIFDPQLLGLFVAFLLSYYPQHSINRLYQLGKVTSKSGIPLPS